MSDQIPLWTGLGLIGPLQARLSGELPRAIGGVSIDTRTLAPGDLFFAITGENSDGHDHVRTAFEKGAAAAVVSEARADALKGAGPLYVVRDVLNALERLGQAARERSKARIVAVTGSVGKTSTKEALRHVLSEAGQTHASVASYNNHWGVPLTLARMPKDSAFGVFEIGMNHSGEITPLVGMVRPHVAIVTTVAAVHSENFPSVEAIADAKAEIFSGIVEGGAAIVNRDIEFYPRLSAAAHASPAGHVLTFGEHEEADARLLSYSPLSDGSAVAAVILGERLTYRLGAPGKHVAMNSLAVLLAARAVGADLRAAAAALAAVNQPQGRGARVTLKAEGGEITLIDESYNANPLSMRAALELLGQSRPAQGGRRIAVIGDMLELGPHSAELHRALAEPVVNAQVDLLFASGPMSRGLFDACPCETRGLWGERSADIETALVETLKPGDVVMIKGSNGSKMGPLVAALKRHFAEPARDSASRE